MRKKYYTSYEQARLHSMATKLVVRQAQFINNIVKLADKNGIDRDVLMYFAVQPLYETILDGTYKEWVTKAHRDV